MAMTLGITGTSGAQGAAIAAAAANAGHKVRRISRAEGGYEDASKLANHMTGVDALIVTSPVDHRAGVREAMMQTIAQAAHMAQVKRIVFNTAATIFDSYDRPVAKNLAALSSIFLNGATPTVVLEPTVYLDNLAAPWAIQAMKQGILPYPASRSARISWISHKTLAQCAIAAASSPSLSAKVTLRIGGAEALSGDELVRKIGKVLGSPVTYVESSMEEFAAMLNGMAGAPAGDDIADYYRHLTDQPNALARDINDAKMLGVDPETVEAWLARML
jgi:NAD(P)H dehydrogenase (quinone)